MSTPPRHQLLGEMCPKCRVKNQMTYWHSTRAGLHYVKCLACGFTWSSKTKHELWGRVWK